MLGEVTSDNFATASDCPIIVLPSGQPLKVHSVKLYEADKVNEIASLKATAAQKFGGVSTGVGFWGSPSWVIGGAVALGVLEGLLSSAARKEGVELVLKANTVLQDMMISAKFFDAAQLANSHVPHPQAWSAIGTSVNQIDVSKLSWLSRKALLSEYGKSENDLEKINGILYLSVKSEKKFIHDGDEFVTIETDTGLINIRWSQVVAYSPPKGRLEGLVKKWVGSD